MVNAAGLYADKIALDFGFSERYRILPFKGLYLYSDEPPGAFRTNIYPVPDLRNPFLGVPIKSKRQWPEIEENGARSGRRASFS